MTATIQANGIRIAYRFDGPEDAPVVLFSNSLMANFSMWEAQVAPVTAKYRMLRYDQRGHGATEVTPGPYTIELLTEDVFALTEALGIKRFHFVGLSMGGFTGQLFAVRHPEKLLSVAICDSACIMPPESLWNERIHVAETEGIAALAQGTLERWFTPPFHVSGKDELERVRRMILGTKAEGYIGCAKAIRDMRLCDNLAKIKTPTLVLVGEKDPACPVAAAEVLHQGIAGSEYVVLKDSAHLPNIEQSAAFNKALLAFLGRH